MTSGSSSGGDAPAQIWDAPAKPKACLVLAHGAGAGMTHKSMEAVAQGLVAREIAVLRYNFPYMERGSKRVDPPADRAQGCASSRRRGPRARGDAAALCRRAILWWRA